jgi:hypothetical protein
VVLTNVSYRIAAISYQISIHHHHHQRRRLKATTHHDVGCSVD